MAWPKGKPRKPQAAEQSQDQAAPAKRKMKKPNWSDDGNGTADKYAKFRATADTRWQDYSGENRLSIDPGTLADHERGGLSFCWLAESCMGQPLDYQLSQFTRNGWTRVEEGDFDDIHIVDCDGLHLYCRDIELTRRAKAYEARKAASVVQTKAEGLIDGNIPGVTLDSRHPTARRSNKINRTYERISIPDSDE